jgi:hypothetical protein
VVKSRKVRWARRGGHTEFWWGNFREKDQLEDLGLDWRIIKGILKK